MSDTPSKVLMIDDEALLLDIYRIAFEKGGFEVYTCTSADDGLALLRTGYTPDVIVHDITMPEKSGYEFLDQLNKEQLRRGSLLVALTNEGQDGEKSRMWELGLDAHIVKSEFLPKQIVEAVRELLQQKRQMENVK